MGTSLQEQKDRAVVIQKYLFNDTTLAEIKKALPEIGLTPQRLARIAWTAISKNPKLQQCTVPSLIRSIILCAQYGLVPDGRQAHLIPYKDECTLIIDYKGLLTLIRRSPNVSNVFAFTIHKGDQYEVQMGTDPLIKHTLPADGAERGEAIAAYSVVRYKDGGFDFDIMSVDDVIKVRDQFSQKDKDGHFSTAWTKSFEEMMKKTVIRRHSKKADISYNVAQAIESDIHIEGGEPLGDFLEGAIIESAPIGPDKKEPDPEFNPQLFREAFEKAVKNAGVKYGKMSLVYEYVAKNAATYKMSAIDVMKNAMQDMGSFMKTYSDWSGAGKEAPPVKKEPPEQKGEPRRYPPDANVGSNAERPDYLKGGPDAIMTDAHASHLIDLCSSYDMNISTVISEMGLEGDVFMLPDRFYSDCVKKIHSLAETMGKEYKG